MCKISAQYVKACRRKMQKTVYFLYSQFTKRHNSFKNWRKVMILKLDLQYIKTKSCAQFQLNMIKHVGENCGKLCISYKFTKRHNFFKNWRKVMTLKLDLKYIKTKSCAKFQLNMSRHVGEKCGKRADGDRTDGRMDGRTDGRRPGRTSHTIIRPVWRRAYKNEQKRK